MISEEPENFTIPATKKCSRCGIEKPLTEYYRNKKSIDKKTCSCKTCLKAYNKTYYQTEKGKAYYKAYNQSEKGKARQKAYYQRRKGKLSDKELDAA